MKLVISQLFLTEWSSGLWLRQSSVKLGCGPQCQYAACESSLFSVWPMPCTVMGFMNYLITEIQFTSNCQIGKRWSSFCICRYTDEFYIYKNLQKCFPNILETKLIWITALNLTVTDGVFYTTEKQWRVKLNSDISFLSIFLALINFLTLVLLQVCRAFDDFHVKILHISWRAPSL